MSDCTQLPIWQQLIKHQAELQDMQMREAFANDPKRFQHFSLEAVGLHLDYSKHLIHSETMGHLFKLAHNSGLAAAITAMFRGDKINHTENRAVLHTALRAGECAPTKVVIDKQAIMPQILAVLAHMKSFTENIRNGNWRGYTGKPISDIVNIGIGGSDLGPVMVTQALQPYWHPHLKVHFVSNVDPAHIADTLKKLHAPTTLFIVASKSFGTPETLSNAHAAREWFLSHSHDEAAIAQHFVAVSTNTEKVSAFGINPANMFGFWDWVGGRYSIWSAVGLSVALMVGMTHFEAFLAGACEMDHHFQTADFEQNMPVIMAMLGIWYNNFWHADTHAVFPYDQHLTRFPAYLQQQDMESNGKRIRNDGQIVQCATGPIIWGEAGTNGQHAFYQLLHQGTRLIPVDFLAAACSHNPIGHQHESLLANCLAQSKALMTGKTSAEVETELRAAGLQGKALNALLPHKIFPGNHPSSTILYQQLDPFTLGALIALYEHKVFVQATIWQINSFDQWGVELGKQLAISIEHDLLHHTTNLQHDASTNGLIKWITAMRAQTCE